MDGRYDRAIVARQQHRRAVRHAHGKQLAWIACDERIRFRAGFECAVALNDLAAVDLMNPASRARAESDRSLKSRIVFVDVSPDILHVRAAGISKIQRIEGRRAQAPDARGERVWNASFFKQR